MTPEFCISPFAGPQSIIRNVPSSLSNHTREGIHTIIYPSPFWVLLLLWLFKFLMKAKRLHQISKNHSEDDNVIITTVYHVPGIVIIHLHALFHVIIPTSLELRITVSISHIRKLRHGRISWHCTHSLIVIQFAVKPLLLIFMKHGRLSPGPTNELNRPLQFLFSKTGPIGEWVLLHENS